MYAHRSISLSGHAQPVDSPKPRDACSDCVPMHHRQAQGPTNPRWRPHGLVHPSVPFPLGPLRCETHPACVVCFRAEAQPRLVARHQIRTWRVPCGGRRRLDPFRAGLDCCLRREPGRFLPTGDLYMPSAERDVSWAVPLLSPRHHLPYRFRI